MNYVDIDDLYVTCYRYIYMILKDLPGSEDPTLHAAFETYLARPLSAARLRCGTIELVKIMHDGYPNRCPFNEIIQRFRRSVSIGRWRSVGRETA